MLDEDTTRKNPVSERARKQKQKKEKMAGISKQRGPGQSESFVSGQVYAAGYAFASGKQQ